MAKFSERLKLLRNEAGFSQQELASQIGGISKSSINMYERGEREPGLETTEAIADFFNVDVDYLYGRTDIRNRYSAVLAAITDEMKSGRWNAEDEMRRLFGTDHSTLSTYACEDKSKLSVLYYNALERRKALSLSAIISKVETLPSDQAEQIELLTYSYLKADQPIRNIVDTALEPYAEDLDDLLCGPLQPDASASDTKPEPTKQIVRPFPKAKVKRRKDDFDELTVFEEAAAAGLGNYLSDTPVTHIEQYPSGMIPAGTNYGVPISGDSMTPRFKDGSTAFVQSTPVINAGEIGIFALNGNSYIKQLIIDRENGTVHLHSLNPNYKDIVVSESDTLYTFGRVLGSYPE